MSAERYPVQGDSEELSYCFISKGPRGSIRKLVRYVELEPGLFSLAFGDWNQDLSRLDDIRRTDNGDKDKVLMTVAYTIFDFFDVYPQAVILIVGSTIGRTRLYQMAISRKWEEISLSFDVKGDFNGHWLPFEYGRNFSSFLIRRK